MRHTLEGSAEASACRRAPPRAYHPSPDIPCDRFGTRAAVPGPCARRPPAHRSRRPDSRGSAGCLGQSRCSARAGTRSSRRTRMPPVPARPETQRTTGRFPRCLPGGTNPATAACSRSGPPGDRAVRPPPPGGYPPADSDRGSRPAERPAASAGRRGHPRLGLGPARAHCPSTDRSQNCCRCSPACARSPSRWSAHAPRGRMRSHHRRGRVPPVAATAPPASDRRSPGRPARAAGSGRQTRAARQPRLTTEPGPPQSVRRHQS